MSIRRRDIPRIDATVTDATLHERCEQVAVPDFDWMSTPVEAVVDGFLHIDPDAPFPPRRRVTAPGPSAAPRRPDDTAPDCSRMLADLSRQMHHR
ncbi:hypothetical protein [Actinoplanes sp. NPDC051851]|uniref:hypothetical protein n=1 Tax=Actinoplanes sp. NPDC051851 TaxID=3154753 RepID=UPI003448D2E3